MTEFIAIQFKTIFSQVVYQCGTNTSFKAGGAKPAGERQLALFELIKHFAGMRSNAC